MLHILPSEWVWYKFEAFLIRRILGVYYGASRLGFTTLIVVIHIHVVWGALSYYILIRRAMYEWMNERMGKAGKFCVLFVFLFNSVFLGAELLAQDE